MPSALKRESSRALSSPSRQTPEASSASVCIVSLMASGVAHSLSLLRAASAGRRVLATRTLTVRLPDATTFAPSGQLGCAPPSPANPTTREARGTATAGDLWARFFARLAGGHSAVLSSVIGKETKIVWRLLGNGDAEFTAVAPSGDELRPAWVSRHEGSSWTRPGDEWGTGFVFSEIGCWQIRVQRVDVRGDLWVAVIA